VVLLYEKSDGVVTVTLNRPQAMNAINGEMAQALMRAWEDFAQDPQARVLIMTGSGERSFCVGADLRERADVQGDPHLGGFWSRATDEMPMRRAAIYKPAIGAINGHCLGGGLELALLCDIRIASENATFGQPEICWGIFPGMGATQRLPRVLPYNLAAEIVLTGRPVGARQALAMGLVNRVVPAGELMAAARELAEVIGRNAPLAVRAAKEALLRSYDLPLEQGLRLEGLLRRAVGETADAREGRMAFEEKRVPRYEGR
jgi:enoyl-CoA hydratase/carnithine racemase